MNCQRLKIAFAGTPEFAAVALDALITSTHEVVSVHTQPDRPAGRGRKLTPSAVKLRALDANIPVYQPLSLRGDEAVEEFAELGADVLVVAAYGLILPKSILDIPALGCLNIHASLLPRWRGAAPIHRAVLEGDSHTGVCIMQMDEGLDTGDVLLEKSIEIGDDELVVELHDRLADLGASALLEALPLRCAEQLTAVPQPAEGVSYAQKLSKSEAHLNFAESSDYLHRCIRAFNPWPVAEGQLDGKRVRVWRSRKVADTDMQSQSSTEPGTILALLPDAIRVKTGDGELDLLMLQWPGKKAQSADQFYQAHDLVGQGFT